MAGRVTRSFYRIVMRTAKLHDAHPALKGLIVTHRIRFYDRQSKAWVSIGQAGDSKEKVSFESAALMRELTGGGVYYLPERSAVQIARNAFKQKMKETDAAVIDLHLDVATSCIRLLEQNLARGRKLGILDWLPPRSHPPQDLYDIQLADSPGVGNMLLAHPLLVQSALTRAVIILVQYEKEKGTFGLVVNRRVPLKVTDLLDTASSLQGVGMSSSVREGLKAFKDNDVYRGGDVGVHFLSILHPHGDLPHAQRLADGIYWQCDLQAAAGKVERGEANASDFRFVLGHAGWGPGQLEGEINNQTWVMTGPRGGGSEGGGERDRNADMSVRSEGKGVDVLGERGAYSSLVFCNLQGEDTEEGEEAVFNTTDDALNAFADEVVAPAIAKSGRFPKGVPSFSDILRAVRKAVDPGQGSVQLLDAVLQMRSPQGGVAGSLSVWRAAWNSLPNHEHREIARLPMQTEEAEEEV